MTERAAVKRPPDTHWMPKRGTVGWHGRTPCAAYLRASVPLPARGTVLTAMKSEVQQSYGQFALSMTSQAMRAVRATLHRAEQSLSPGADGRSWERTRSPATSLPLTHRRFAKSQRGYGRVVYADGSRGS